ncbi:serine-enriched protein-like [Haliotis asinina]|uniref:serine-enriched protein-like n=1 Tax=Haliotis asinina TaxID=109174 RepID=UPI003531B489
MPDMCDVTFLVGKTKVPVHGVKAILATRSRYLYQLVLKHQKQSMQDISKTKKSKKVRESALSQRLPINVPDYQALDFKAFIKFVHSGKARIDLCNVIGLLCSAVEFGFTDLQAACMEFIHRCRGQGQGSVLLDYAWNYQHKLTAQKLICQMSSVTR